nr:Deblocking aminopeptidase (EC 3.4.11.-) [uncultured bacterium]
MDLKQLCEIHAPSGNEKQLRDLLLAEAKRLCGEENARIDRMGNVLCFRKGREVGHPHVCVTAHMDEVGFIIRSAADDGLLRFRPVGGIDPRVVVSKRVLVGEKKLPGVIGAMPIHLQTEDDLERVLDFDRLYIDIGAKSKDEAMEKCPPGTYACFDTPYAPFGDGFVCAKALDDRVGCYNLLELMREDYPGDVTFAFVIREESGLRGSAGAAFTIRPDIALNLEGTAANDLGTEDSVGQVCCAGKGVAVSFMDNSSIGQRQLFRKLMLLADREGIAHQPKRGVTGGNDAARFQRAAAGALTCTLSVPCRYIHSGASVCCLSDIEAQYALVRAFLLNV